MVNYQNGKIYTLKSPNCDKYYIGSTTQLLCKRKQKHISEAKINNKDTVTTSKIIIDAGDCFIQLLELFPCNTKEELLKREGELIRQYKNELVNKTVNGRTKKEYYEETKNDRKEYVKKYQETNKDIIREKHKIYRDNNKDKIKEQRKIYIDNNKDKVKEQSKKWSDNNKDKVKLYNSNINKHIKCVCECGGKYTNKHKSTHEKTQKHIKFIQDFQQQHQE